MRLRPLEQWICDRCGELIKKPDDGWLEWLVEDGDAFGFKVVHQFEASPRQPNGDCYHYSDYPKPGGGPSRHDVHLDSFLGHIGLARMLSLVDLGSQIDADYSGPRVADWRSWAETFKRLHLPMYEEARQYFPEAESDGYFADFSEVAVYSESTLRSIIEQYGQRGD